MTGNLIAVPDTGAGGLALDPYSEWLFGYGDDFDFSTIAASDDPDDFSHVAQVQEGGADLPPGAAIELFTLRRNAAPDIRVRLMDLPRGPQSVAARLAALFAGLTPPLRSLAYRTPLRAKTEPRAPADIANLAWPLPGSVDPARRDVVVTGIIDDGLNLAHERFRIGAGSTRVDYAWIQDGAAKGEHVGFGREILRDEIEQAIAATRGDDWAALRGLGLADFSRPNFNPVARAASHGTAVLDMAAGADPVEAEANQRIVAVQAPSLATLETSGAVMGFFVICGLFYIFERARVISRELGYIAPVVVNFSYGFAGGPHDGNQFIERAIDAVVEDHRRRLAADPILGSDIANCVAEVVLPSGNRNLARGHAESRPAAANSDATLTLDMRMQPGDQTASYLELWAPLGARDLRLTVTPPNRPPLVVYNGAASLDDRPVDRNAVLLVEAGKSPDEGTVARITIDDVECPLPPDDSGKKRILLAFAPTDPPPTAAGRSRAPAGLWRIAFAAKVPSDGQRLEAWIQRDDSLFGYRFLGRQCYFDDAAFRLRLPNGDYDQFDPLRHSPGSSVVRREGSLSGIATGEGPVVIGGYSTAEFFDARSFAAYPYRLAGYVAAAKGVEASPDTRLYADTRYPDAAGAVDVSRVRAGQIVAGSMSGSAVALGGTSLAAPQALRLMAQALADPAIRPGFSGRDFIKAAVVQNVAQPEYRRRMGEGALAPDLAHTRRSAALR